MRVSKMKKSIFTIFFVRGYCGGIEMFWRSKIIIQIFLLLLVPSLSFGATYYVRTDGNDACNGQYDVGGSSGNCAKATLNGVQSISALGGGDTVYVRPGTYTGAVTLSKSGASDGSRITYTGTTSAIITTTAASPAITVSGNYITIDGLKVANTGCTDFTACIANAGWADHASFRFSGTTSYVTVQNCLIDSGATVSGPYGNSIIVNGTNSYITFTGNTIRNLNYAKGIWNLGPNTTYVTISNNTVSTTWDTDIFYFGGWYHLISGNDISGDVIYNSAYNHADIFQIAYNSGWKSGYTIIENNYVHDTQSQLGSMACDPAPDTGWQTYNREFTWRNNIFANVSASLRIGIPACKVYNNLFYNVGSDTVGGTNNALEIGGNTSVYDNTGLEIYNNAFVGNEYVLVQNGAGTTPYTHDYNFIVNANYSVKSLPLYPGVSWAETHPISAGNPQFVAPSTNCVVNTCDFHIGSTSALRNVGLDLYSITKWLNLTESPVTPLDKDGVARPIGSAWDIGSYEYASGGVGKSSISLSLSASGDSNGGRCLIATATFGSCLDHHVVVLRDFRERYSQ